MSIQRYQYLAIDWKSGDVQTVEDISSIWRGAPGRDFSEYSIYIIT